MTKKRPTLRSVYCLKPVSRLLGSPRKEKGMETRKIMGIQDLILTCIFSTHFLRIILKVEARLLFIICNAETFMDFTLKWVIFRVHNQMCSFNI